MQTAKMLHDELITSLQRYAKLSKSTIMIKPICEVREMSWARWIGFHSLVVDAATQQHWYVATYLFRNGWPSVEFAAYEKDTFSSFAHGNLFWMTYDSERTCLETHFHSAYEKRSEVTWH